MSEPSKHNISRAGLLYQGGAYDALLYHNNERHGVRLDRMVSYGDDTVYAFYNPGWTPSDASTPDSSLTPWAPLVAVGTAFLNGATTTQLPANNTTTIKYLTSASGTAPLNGSISNVAPISLLVNGGTTASVWPLDFPRTISLTGSTSGAYVSMTALVTGYDQYLQPMQESITCGTATTVNGKKAFAYISEIDITAAGNAQTACTLSVGFSDILGLPYYLDYAHNLVSVWFNEVQETTAPTIVVGDTTNPTTTTTGDVRGTILINSHGSFNGSKVVFIRMVVNPQNRQTLLGVPQVGAVQDGSSLAGN